MVIPPPDRSVAPAKWKPLDAHLRRVLGVLIEKAKTTPAGYPMSVNAIVSGCNQKNNRDPLMALDDIDVGNALGDLITLGAVTEVDWLGRVPKYKHLAYDWLGVSKAELAVLAELLLRGAQALGELRARAARMEPIADLAALKPIVDALVARGLMIEMTPAGRGQIVNHTLYPAAERAEWGARHAGQVGRAASTESMGQGRLQAAEPGRQPESPPGPSPAAAPPSDARDRGPEARNDHTAQLALELTSLREVITRLRDEVSDLREKVSRLEARVAERG